MISAGFISSQAAPSPYRFKIIHPSLHPVDLKIIHQKEYTANIKASKQFQLCPYTWKVTESVVNRFPRQIVEAECKIEEKCIFCIPLYYHLLVRITAKDGQKSWQSHRVPVAFIRNF